MMDDIFIYNKTLEERLTDYNDILRLDGRTLPASQIKKEWSFYLDLVIDHAGWQALWNIPQEQCELYDIDYPNAAITYVEDVLFDTLTAKVKVLAVKNDIYLPSNYIQVNLTDLYPTIEQDQSIALNIAVTSENLDMLRFFYNNVWMPWDEQEDEIIDWPATHLETRLKLFYDIKSGLVPRNFAIEIKSLITEARDLIQKLQTIQGDDTISESEESCDWLDPQYVYEVTRIEKRLPLIRYEFELYENPTIRAAFVKNLQKKTPSHKNWLIFLSQTVQNHIEYLQKYDTCSKSVAEIATNLKDALKNASDGDTIYLSSGKYVADYLGNFEYGGRIIGLFEPTDTILSDEKNVIKLFEIFSNSVSFENLTFRFEHAVCGIAVRKGQVVLKNCILEGIKQPRKCREGIIVYPGAQLVLDNCHLHGFNIGILCKAGGKVRLLDCNISRCNTGLMLYDPMELNIQRTSVTQCANYGICLESENLSSAVITVGELNSFEGMFANDITVNESGKADIKIMQKKISIKQLHDNTPSKNSVTTKTKTSTHSENENSMEGIELLK